MRAAKPDLTLLGSLPDGRLAEMWGVTALTVLTWRRKRGITAAPVSTRKKGSSASRFAIKDTKILGTMTDEKAAKVLGVGVRTVISTRRRHGIKATRDWQKVDWTKVDWSKSGNQIAEECGCTASAVSRARKLFGSKKKRGPEKGEGGRPVGPPKVKLSPMVLESTADWLRAKYPQAKTLHAAASQALDDLSGSNVQIQP